jgi:hydroxyacylglutathione hydrolase
MMYFKQIKKYGDNFSYIVADETTREALIVDSSFNAEEISRVIKAENFSLKYIVNTHGHSDHTAGNFELKSAFGGEIVAHGLSRIRADTKVEDDDLLKVGAIEVRVIYTPGHTPDSICLLLDGAKLLTGDTLFVGECGRTDLPGGKAQDMYNSLFDKLLKLGDEIEVYPGHDYGAKPSSTIGEERRSNYVLQPRSLRDFVEFMSQP